MNQTTVTNNKRINWLDGIKGISCLFIFFHHFCLNYFPATYSGSASPSHANGFDIMLASSPFGFIVNGNFFVHLFIFISGYVITATIISYKPEKVGIFLFKRYLKLLFPLAVYTFVMFLIKVYAKLGETNFVIEIIKELYRSIKALLFGVLFTGDTYLGTHLWMLNIIFLGGIFVSIISSLCWTYDGKKVVFVPAAIGLMLFFFPTLINLHFATIFWGCALYIFNYYYEFKIRNCLAIILIFLGLFFGGFPSGLIPDNFYRFFIIPKATSESYFLWHCFAAFIIIFSVSKSEILQKFFSRKIFLFLASISLWVYLSHGIVMSFTQKIFNLLQEKNVGYLISAIIVLFATTVILILESFIISKYILPLGNTIISKLFLKLEIKTKTEGECSN